MDLSNGYYEDCNKKLYKVDEKDIFQRVDDNWKPLLYPQNFVMYWKHGLLTKKDICELELETGSLPLYLEGDCPEEIGTLPLTVDEEIFLLEEELEEVNFKIEKVYGSYSYKVKEVDKLSGLLHKLEENQEKIEAKICSLKEELKCLKNTKV